MNLTTDFQTFETKSLAPSLAALDAHEALIDEVWRGLRKHPRSLVPWTCSTIPRSSSLFECITALPEYYPSRTGMAFGELCQKQSSRRLVPTIFGPCACWN